MPNWCNCSFTVSHPEKDMILKFAKAIDEGNLLNTFVPMPEEIRNTTSPSEANQELIEKYGFSDWYGWAVENWGTKWDITNGNIDLEEDRLSGHGWFDTAWGPPVEAMRRMSEQGFVIDLMYLEAGCGFAGHYTSENDDYCVDYDFSDPDWRDLIDDDEVISHLEPEYDYYLEMIAEEQREDDGA